MFSYCGARKSCLRRATLIQYRTFISNKEGTCGHWHMAMRKLPLAVERSGIARDSRGAGEPINVRSTVRGVLGADASARKQIENFHKWHRWRKEGCAAVKLFALYAEWCLAFPRKHPTNSCSCYLTALHQIPASSKCVTSSVYVSLDRQEER
jgi:hypothetical protein